MEFEKPYMHYTAEYMLNPTNALTVNLIGAGGTGSQMVTSLAKMNHALTELGHPGFQVRLWDGDRVTRANLGRQLFASQELNQNKAVALINRINGFFGTNWKAMSVPYSIATLKRSEVGASANLFISCVDNVSARREIATIIKELASVYENHRDKPYYWMDCGNGQHTGQVIIATVGDIPQRKTKLYKTVSNMPFITDEFADLLDQADKNDNTPSCSLAEALEKQELFINPTLANHASSLLWSMFRKAMIPHRGCFINLESMRTTPLAVR